MDGLEEKENIRIKNKLISNTFYLFLDWIAVTATGFFYWFLAGKLLLPGEYGVVSTSINLALILSGLSLVGMHAVVWKLTPEYLERGQKSKVFSLIKFSFISVLISNIIALIIILALSPFLAPVLKVPVLALILSGLVLFSYALVLLFRYIIYGFQNMKVLAITDFVGQFVKVFVSPVMIFLGFKYIGPLVGFLLGNILIILLRIKYVPLKSKVPSIDKKHIIYTYALPAFITMVAWLIFFNGQYVILSALKDPEVTGYYTVAMTLSSILAVIPATLNSALLPITSQLSVKGNIEKQRRLVELIFRYGLLITIPLSILLVVFSETAVILFSRVEYLEAARLLPLLVLGAVSYGIGNIFLENIYAIGKTKVYRNIVVVVSAIFLLLAFPLIYFFSAFGSAIAYVVTTLLWSFLSFLYIRKFLGFSLSWLNTAKLIAANIIFFVFLYELNQLYDTLLFKVILALAGIVIYLSALVIFRFHSKDDIRILDVIIRKSPVFKKQLAYLWKIILKMVNKS